MAKYTKHYEEVIEDFLDRGLIDPEQVRDSGSLWKELKKNDPDDKVTVRLFEELLETRRYKEIIADNLTVKTMVTKDVVSDGQKYEIKKPRKVEYIRQGRRVVYYTRGSVPWTNKEVKWLRTNKALPTKLLLYRYYQEFGTKRTVSSIKTRRYRMSEGGERSGLMKAKKKSVQKKRDRPTEEDIRRDLD